MKRSEMLKLMWDEVTSTRTYMETTMEILDKAIRVAEENGMLPPCRDADQKSSYGYARIFEWDKE